MWVVLSFQNHSASQGYIEKLCLKKKKTKQNKKPLSIKKIINVLCKPDASFGVTFLCNVVPSTRDTVWSLCRSLLQGGGQLESSVLCTVAWLLHTQRMIPGSRDGSSANCFGITVLRRTLRKQEVYVCLLRPHLMWACHGWPGNRFLILGCGWQMPGGAPQPNGAAAPWDSLLPFSKGSRLSLCISVWFGGYFASLSMVAAGLRNSSGNSVIMLYNSAGKIRSNELLAKGPFVVIASDFVDVFCEVRQVAEGFLPLFILSFIAQCVCVCVCVCVHAPCASVWYKWACAASQAGLCITQNSLLSFSSHFPCFSCFVSAFLLDESTHWILMSVSVFFVPLVPSISAIRCLWLEFLMTEMRLVSRLWLSW